MQRSTHETNMVVSHGSLKSRGRSRSPVIQVEARCEKCRGLKDNRRTEAICPTEEVAITEMEGSNMETMHLDQETQDLELPKETQEAAKTLTREKWEYSNPYDPEKLTMEEKKKVEKLLQQLDNVASRKTDAHVLWQTEVTMDDFRKTAYRNCTELDICNAIIYADDTTLLIEGNEKKEITEKNLKITIRY